MERKEGYYWVKYFGDWVPAKWEGERKENPAGGWWLENSQYDTDDWDEIDENRILSPDDVKDIIELKWDEFQKHIQNKSNDPSYGIKLDKPNID